MKLIERILPSADAVLARAMAEKIALQYPPKNEPKLQLQGGRKRLTSILDLVMSEITQYQRQERMGLIRKARFGNEFRWKLAEIGYTDVFVDALTEGVVAHLATCLKDHPSQAK